MHYYLDRFEKICKSLDEGPKNLKKILHSHDFKDVSKSPEPLTLTGKYLVGIYCSIHAPYTITIHISTDVKHACYSDEEEMHYIVLSLYDNDILLNTKAYTYRY